jgi:anti-sigma-K factor RskA
MTACDPGITDLLGAYALDAVEPDEARTVEGHLAMCPKCRAEVATLRETASLLAYAGTDAPEGVWARIGAEIGAGSDAHAVPSTIEMSARPQIARSNRSRGAFAAVAAIAATAIAVLGFAVSHLNNQVDALQRASRASGLTPLVASALAGPHRIVTLTSIGSSGSASVAVTGGGTAFWLGSTLPTLPGNRTYQIWGATNGRIVSLGLLGPTPGKVATFRVQSGTSKLMVTDEPKGGSPSPTTPVLATGPIPTAI